MSADFKHAVEQVKLRLPIEEVVREHVPALKRQGSLWTACCPFHEERTPSFKVDPRRGTWHCFGACGTGGDVISFVMRAQNVEFNEALETLAARAGVTLPERSRDARGGGQDAFRELYDALARAERFYRRCLYGAEGARALAYVRGRGLSDVTIEAFGIGCAPPGFDRLVRGAREAGAKLETLVEAGLARRNDAGETYDFFRGRLMIPVRDLKGRTVGFGARRLPGEDEASPKYVNTPETALFRKGQLVYGLDRALATVRKGGRMALVEGYTDVMAAHQAGLSFAVAVLGTATTDEHAALVRRSGARRVTLAFDGDEAGRKATFKALWGLLPLDLSIDVVRLPGGEDPCDFLVREGGAAFERRLEGARGWFEFLLGDLGALPSGERARAADGVLELIARLSRPLQRQERLQELAGLLGVPVESARGQFESLPERRREAARRARASADAAAASTPERSAPDRSARRGRAWRILAGAVVLDPALLPRLEPLVARCPDPGIRRVLDFLGSLPETPRSAHEVLAALAADVDGWHLVAELLDEVKGGESAHDLFQANLDFLACEDVQGEFLERRAALAPEHEEARHRQHLAELHEALRRRQAAADAARRPPLPVP